MIILAPLAVVLATAAILALIIALWYVLYVGPLLHWFTRPGPGFLGGLIRWVARPATRRVEDFMVRHMATLIRAFATGIQPMIVALDQLTVVQLRVAGSIEGMAEQTWRALWTLRHETVPRLITTALVPVRAQLGRHTDRLNDIEDLNRRTAVVVGTGLRSLPWGAPGTYVGNFQQWWNSYSHLWTQTFEHIVPRLNRIQFDLLPAIGVRLDRLTADVTRIREQALPAIRQRLGRIEDAIEGLLANPTTWVLGALGAGMLPALSAGGMRTALRNLTCRNTQDVTSRLCATDPAFLAQLLAGTLLFALALDPRVIARAGQEVAGGLDGVFRAMALR